MDDTPSIGRIAGGEHLLPDGGHYLAEMERRFIRALPGYQAQQSVAQANDQYVASLYRHNMAKLSLARALGAGKSYKTYVGGK